MSARERIVRLPRVDADDIRRVAADEVDRYRRLVDASDGVNGIDVESFRRSLAIWEHIYGTYASGRVR